MLQTTVKAHGCEEKRLTTIRCFWECSVCFQPIQPRKIEFGIILLDQQTGGSTGYNSLLEERCETWVWEPDLYESEKFVLL
jgi:hypothetical protein